MRKSTAMIFLALEATVVAAWWSSLNFERGVDSALYHNMASAITTYGYAPWIVNPLSYIGIYPGSDSSGVPFLLAEITALAGLPATASVLIYNFWLLMLLGLGLFTLTRTITHRLEAPLASMLMGSLAYGFFTLMLWTLDERSINVAFTPVFLYLVLSIKLKHNPRGYATSAILILPTSVVMLASHLNFLLLLPLVVLVPLVIAVTRKQSRLRRRRLGSVGYFGAVVAVPLGVIVFMAYSGLMQRLGLEFTLEHSAILSGTSPLAYFVNSAVFLTTRSGPVIMVLAGIGVLYMGSRRFLSEDRILFGAILLGGLVGLPIIVYSKDLATPVLVLPASVVIARFVARRARRRPAAAAVVALVVISGSTAFNAWNQSRGSSYDASLYWTSPGISQEPATLNLYIGVKSSAVVCIYGNNWLAVRYVSTAPFELLCGDSAVEDMMRVELGQTPLVSPHFRFLGVNGGPPNTWFDSPELDRVAEDFARIPSSSYAVGRAILLEYRVDYIVVALSKPTYVPLYQFQGVSRSEFFSELWSSAWPMYQTSGFAVFAV